MRKSSKITFLNIVITIVAIIIVAGLGSFFVNMGMSWFDALEKPSQWIPNFVIPIAWTIIYLLFALVLFLWQRKENLPKNIIILLIINGFLNLLWCLVFFTLKQLFLGNVIIIINALFAIKLISEISKIKKVYAIVLSLYPIWVCIACYLNLALWVLN